MSSSANQGDWANTWASVSLKELDEELERIPGLSEAQREAIWLCAWTSRENAMRVAEIALPAQ